MNNDHHHHPQTNDLSQVKIEVMQDDTIKTEEHGVVDNPDIEASSVNLLNVKIEFTEDKMEDDIDTKEHVLDDPRVKDILPDLSKVKTEVMEDDDVTIKEENVFLNIKQEIDFNKDHHYAINRTELKDCTVPNVSKVESDITIEEDDPFLQIKREVDFNTYHQGYDGVCMTECNNLTNANVSKVESGALNTGRRYKNAILQCGSLNMTQVDSTDQSRVDVSEKINQRQSFPVDSAIQSTDRRDVNISLLDKDMLMKKHNLEFRVKSGEFIKNPPIPISVLFKCSKCDMHFILTHFALNHWKVCKEVICKYAYKCEKCFLKFRSYDAEMHKLQHVVSKSLKVYIIQRNLAKTLLCRCPKCDVCYSERLFWEHLKRSCNKESSIYCNKCNLYINQESYLKRAHTVLCTVHVKTCTDNVVIDYFDCAEETKFKTQCAIESVGEKSEKIKNTLCIYQCIKCECFIDNYDNAVRHAQSHITKTSQETIHCRKCNRIFESSSFREHEHNLAKYNILKFDYKKLLSDGWFDLFNGLDHGEIGDILRDSVFKDTRSLDLNLVQEGDPDMTLYVCSSCNVIVEKTVLENHVAKKQYCSEKHEFRCCFCDLYFYWSRTMKEHRKLHCNGFTKEDFRIISINSIDKMPLDSAALEKCTDGEPINASDND